MTIRRCFDALLVGAYAGAWWFGVSSICILPLTIFATMSWRATFIGLAASGMIALVGALLAGRGTYRGDLEAGRRRGGCCPRCGYDLRQSTGRCPECGRPFRRA